MIDSRLLRHVLAVADAGSFSRAADALGISQPALSRSIAGLEQQFDLRLFDRGPRSVLPTAAGRVFIQEARSILAQSRALEQQLLQLRTTEFGQVAIGCGAGIAATVLPTLLQRVVRERPHLNVNVLVQSAESLLQALYDEQLDFFAVVETLVSNDERLEIRTVGKLDAGLFVRPAHPLANRKDIPIEEIKTYPILSGGTPSRLRVSASSIVPPTVICDNYHILATLASNTDAILYGGALMAERVAPNLLVPLDVSEVQRHENYPIALVRLRGRTLSPASLLVKAWFERSLWPLGDAELPITA